MSRRVLVMVAGYLDRRTVPAYCQTTLQVDKYPWAKSG